MAKGVLAFLSAVILWAPLAYGQADKAARVRAMFDGIAPTYERVNHVLSAWRDVRWRRRAVALARTNASDRVLDLACGLHPLAFPWMGLPLTTQYYAYDIHQPRVDLIGHFFNFKSAHCEHMNYFRI